MSYSTQQDILDFVEDNNVKFVRFAFCDIFGTQKNIAVLANDLPKALEDGVCFDGSSIAGFMKVEESDLVLRPDLSTVTILPWRPTEGRVMQFFCDVDHCQPVSVCGQRSVGKIHADACHAGFHHALQGLQLPTGRADGSIKIQNPFPPSIFSAVYPMNLL